MKIRKFQQKKFIQLCKDFFVELNIHNRQQQEEQLFLNVKTRQKN